MVAGSYGAALDKGEGGRQHSLCDCLLLARYLLSRLARWQRLSISMTIDVRQDSCECIDGYGMTGVLRSFMLGRVLPSPSVAIFISFFLDFFASLSM